MKFIKGDIVVCLQDMGSWVYNGEICELGGKYWDKVEVNEKGYIKAITVRCPDGNGTNVKTEFRHATSNEINAYKHGIRNICQLPQVISYEIY